MDGPHHRTSTSWTVHQWTVHVMDGFGRRTMIIYDRWTEVDGRTDGLSISWTDSDDGPCKFSIDGRRRTAGRRQTVHLMDEFGRQTMIICPRWTEVDGGRRRTVHLMDGFRRRTIRNLKMWTEVDGWTDGRKSVRGGLL